MSLRIAKIFTVIFSVISMSLWFSGCATVEWEDYMLELEYTEGYKIMQLADIQADTSESCDNAFADIKKLVEKEKPDLIVLTGDNIDIPQNDGAFIALVSNMEDLQTPWAPVFGNHDAEGVLTKDFMAEKFLEAEHCLFYKGEEGVDGVGNYVVNLTTKRSRIAYSLFMIDSNMYDGNGGYDSIHANQIEWYERAVKKLTEINHNKVVPSLAFFHIPLHEVQDARESYERGESSGFANFNEGVFPGTENTGFFSKAQELNSTKGIFCGHEHINTCDIDYQGIHLVYGLKSSRCSYYDSSLLGATIITLSKDGMEIRNAYFE